MPFGGPSPEAAAPGFWPGRALIDTAGLNRAAAPQMLPAMSKHISRLWILGPPFAIGVSLLAYYSTFRPVRQWVDAKFPWVEENIGSRLPPMASETKSAPAPRRAAPPRANLPSREPAPEEPPRPVAPPPPPTFFAADGSVDLPRLAADRNAWPATVILKKAKQFPAVVNGKVVGKVEVPTGAEAKVVAIQDGKIGVEYQGGGAWLTVDETDLPQRLRR